MRHAGASRKSPNDTPWETWSQRLSIGQLFLHTHATGHDMKKTSKVFFQAQLIPHVGWGLEYLNA